MNCQCAALTELNGLDAEQYSSRHLQLLEIDPATWTTVYKCPNTGEYWLLDYPQGELQGGGPPRLRKTSVQTPKPTCVLVRSDKTYEGKQGLTYDVGIFAGNTGAKAICLHGLTIPPGGKAKSHYHAGHETAIYVISGEAGIWYGDDLKEHLTVRAGDYLYIPAGVPHLPYNPSETESCVAVLARTDPNEQESVVLLEG